MQTEVHEMEQVIAGARPPLTQSVVSVTDMVAKALAQHNTYLAERWVALSCKDIIDGFTVPEQMGYISDFWRLRLGHFTIDTIDNRASLSGVADLDQWLDNFKHDIVPIIVRCWDGC